MTYNEAALYLIALQTNLSMGDRSVSRPVEVAVAIDVVLKEYQLSQEQLLAAETAVQRLMDKSDHRPGEAKPGDPYLDG